MLVLGMHEKNTLAQLEDVARRAERVALMAGADELDPHKDRVSPQTAEGFAAPGLRAGEPRWRLSPALLHVGEFGVEQLRAVWTDPVTEDGLRV